MATLRTNWPAVGLLMLLTGCAPAGPASAPTSLPTSPPAPAPLAFGSSLDHTCGRDTKLQFTVQQGWVTAITVFRQ